MNAPSRGGSPAYECPFCNAVSHDPNDAHQRYCGRCHRFSDTDGRWLALYEGRCSSAGFKLLSDFAAELRVERAARCSTVQHGVTRKTP